MALDLTGLGSIADFAKGVVDRIWPDPATKAKALQDLEELKQKGDLAQLAADTGLAQGQIDINKIEAASSSLWVSGWRPGIGWVCMAILALTYIPKALTLTGFWAYQAYVTFKHPELKLPAMPPFPDLGYTDLLGILGTLLGSAHLAQLRTQEKKAGVA